MTLLSKVTKDWAGGGCLVCMVIVSISSTNISTYTQVHNACRAGLPSVYCRSGRNLKDESNPLSCTFILEEPVILLTGLFGHDSSLSRSDPACCCCCC